MAGLFGDDDLHVGVCVGSGEGRGAGTKGRHLVLWGKGLLGLLVGLSGDDDLHGGGCVVGGEGRGAGTERELLVPQ